MKHTKWANDHLMGSDPNSTYFIMSVWPVNNPCKAIGAMEVL